MSYDIRLLHPVSKKVLTTDVPHDIRGGTYCVGGTSELHLNVTYNYAKHLYRVFPERFTDYPHPCKEDGSLQGIRSIYGMTGAESIPVLDAAIAQLGDDMDDNYWEPTEGNVKAALYGLRALAQLRPDGVWDGD